MRATTDAGACAIAPCPRSRRDRVGSSATAPTARPSCGLHAHPDATAIALDACPAWILPNAGAQGYYWVGLDEPSLDALLAHGWAQASTAEQLWIFESLAFGLEDGSVTADAALARLPALLSSPPPVVERITSLLSFVRNHLLGDEQRPAFDRIVAEQLRPIYERTEWHDEERDRVLIYLALEARDPRVRSEVAERGRRYLEEPEPASLSELYAPEQRREIAMAVAIQEGGAAVFDSLLARAVATEQRGTRSRLMAALALSDVPEQADRAAIALRRNRASRRAVARTLWRRLRIAETRADGWRWALGALNGDASVVAQLRAMCTNEAAAELERAVGPARASEPEIARAIHRIRTCTAIARVQAPHARAFVEQAASTQSSSQATRTDD